MYENARIFMNFDGCFIQNLCLVKKIHLKIFHMGFHTPHVQAAVLHIWVSHMFHASILQLRSWSNLSGAPKPVLPRSGRLSGLFSHQCHLFEADFNPESTTFPCI